MTDKEKQAFRVKALMVYKDKCKEDHIKWVREQHLATCEIDNLTRRLEQIKEKVGFASQEYNIARESWIEESQKLKEME